MIPVWAKLVAILGLLAAVFGAGWRTEGWRMQARYEAQETAMLQEERDRTTKALAERDNLQAILKTSDDAHAAALQKVKDENDSLRDHVSSGSVRLRVVAARCPGSPSVSQAAAASGVDPDTAPELAPAARPAYFALRDGIGTVTSQLTACQAELKLRSE